MLSEHRCWEQHRIASPLDPLHITQRRRVFHVKHVQCDDSSPIGPHQPAECFCTRTHMGVARTLVSPAESHSIADDRTSPRQTNSVTTEDRIVTNHAHTPPVRITSTHAHGWWARCSAPRAPGVTAYIHVPPSHALRHGVSDPSPVGRVHNHVAHLARACHQPADTCLVRTGEQ